MIAYLYVWKVPVERGNDFIADWEELTLLISENKLEYGLKSAVLQAGENGTMVAVAEWKSEVGWQKWRKDFATHPYREKWRQFRVYGPERAHQTVSIP